VEDGVVIVPRQKNAGRMGMQGAVDAGVP